MKLGTAIIIFFVAIIALVAEIFLYFIFGLGAAFSGSADALAGTAMFFGILMVMTIATAILAPICAGIEIVVKKVVDLSQIKRKKENKIRDWFLKDIGTSLLLIFLTLTLILSIVIGSAGMNELSEDMTSTDNEYKTITETGFPTTDTEPTQNSNKNNPETNYIAKYLSLENVKVGQGYGQYDMPGYDPIKPTVEGKIRNEGDKTINEVEITVYFLDKTEKRIGEKTYNPVFAGTIFGDATPLKPNYVRDFGYVVHEDAPSEWDSKVEVEITDISFE
jgi:hypothetical protein